MNMGHMFVNLFIGMNCKSVTGLVVNGCAADNKIGKFQAVRFKIVENLRNSLVFLYPQQVIMILQINRGDGKILESPRSQSLTAGSFFK